MAVNPETPEPETVNVEGVAVAFDPSTGRVLVGADASGGVQSTPLDASRTETNASADAWTDLINRLTAAIDADERAASNEARGWETGSRYEGQPINWVHHVRRWTVDRVRACCAADRKILAAVQRFVDGHPGACTNEAPEGVVVYDGCDLCVEWNKTTVDPYALSFLAERYGPEESEPGRA